jgi:hypothetical protein
MHKETETMKPERAIGLIVGLIVLIGSHGAAFAQGPPPAPVEEQPEVLTRGPVHEAFAEPVNLEIQASVVAPIEPPPNIQEIPPEERPQGEQFAWVPGYWSWDGDRNAYIWVSACWRAAPPNMYWVPGHWSPVTETRSRGTGVEVRVGGVVDVRVGGGQARSAEVVGWEWVAGFWAPAGVEEIEYLPAPPAPVDIEPPGPPPSAGRMWVPGCWYRQEGRYVRRSGYWLQPRADWVWVPSHYAWTPRGYVFCQGHWDYSLERRGVLFAPVYFPRSVYGRSGFTYSPSIAIDMGLLRINLFVYPRYNHYYFGDYYDDAYVRVGIFPRFQSASRHTYYDPIYLHDRWQNQRTEPRWEERQRQEYNRRRDDKDLRPARTYREQETRLAKMPEPQRRAQQVAQPLTAVITSRQTPLKFERIQPAARQKFAKQASQVHKFSEDRNRWEAAAEDHPKAVERPTGAKPPAEPKSSPEANPPDRPRTAPPRVVIPPAGQKEPVTPPPADNKAPGRGENKVPAPTGVAEHEQGPPVAADRKPGADSPREVRVTKPERVKIPKPPIVGQPVDPRKPEYAPPPKPEEERKSEADTKGRERGSDKDKERGN